MTSLLCQIPGKHVLIAYTKGMGRGSRTARGVLLGANDLVRAKEEKPFHSGHVYSEQRLAKSLSGTELFIAAEGNVGEPKNRCVDFSGTHEFVLRTPNFLPGVTGEKRSMIDDWDMDFLDDIHKKSEPPVVDIPVDMELGASKDKTVITVPGEPGIRLEADTDMIVCAEERMTAYNPGDRLEWIIKITLR